MLNNLDEIAPLLPESHSTFGLRWCRVWSEMCKKSLQIPHSPGSEALHRPLQLFLRVHNEGAIAATGSPIGWPAISKRLSLVEPVLRIPTLSVVQSRSTKRRAERLVARAFGYRRLATTRVISSACGAPLVNSFSAAVTASRISRAGRARFSRRTRMKRSSPNSS